MTTATQTPTDKTTTFDAVVALLSARKNLDKVSPVVTRNKARVLRGMKPVAERTGEVITDPRFDWTMSQDDFVAYDALVTAGWSSDGLSPVKPGCCPKAEAEMDVIFAENDVLNSMHGTTKLFADDYYDRSDRIEMIQIAVDFWKQYIR